MNAPTHAPAVHVPHSASAPKPGEKCVMWLIAVAIVVLAVVAALPGWTRASPTLYSTAAQVIPVLIIAITVDQVWRPIWTDWSGRKWVLRIIVAALLLGEAGALIGSAYDVNMTNSGYVVPLGRLFTDLLELLTVVAIGVGLAAVMWGTVFQPDLNAASDARAGPGASETLVDVNASAGVSQVHLDLKADMRATEVHVDLKADPGASEAQGGP